MNAELRTACKTFKLIHGDGEETRQIVMSTEHSARSALVYTNGQGSLCAILSFEKTRTANTLRRKTGLAWTPSSMKSVDVEYKRIDDWNKIEKNFYRKMEIIQYKRPVARARMDLAAGPKRRKTLLERNEEEVKQRRYARMSAKQREMDKLRKRLRLFSGPPNNCGSICFRKPIVTWIHGDDDKRERWIADHVPADAWTNTDKWPRDWTKYEGQETVLIRLTPDVIDDMELKNLLRVPVFHIKDEHGREGYLQANTYYISSQHPPDDCRSTDTIVNASLIYHR